jgi:CDP-2,3-bis-(O-geranylgeranyl)-sn-glycerol synthase
LYRITQLLYLLLPVYAANMAAPFSKYWPGKVRPISERWLGSHKTYLGYVLAICAATITCWVQSKLGWSGSLVNYREWFALGPVCGLAAMLGDSVKSLVKRSLHIAPGRPWVPADQLDFVIAGIAVLTFWVPFTWMEIGFLLAFSFAADILVNRLSCWLGIKETPW